MPITVSAKPEERYIFGGSAAFNCYFPMPFNRRAKVVIENQNDVPYGQYFYIDYELYRDTLATIRLLPCSLAAGEPCQGWGPQLQTNSPETNIAHLERRETTWSWRPKAAATTSGCNLSGDPLPGELVGRRR